MKTLLHRFLPLFLALVLALSLAVPVWAVEPGLTLSQTTASLPVGGTLTLTATFPEGVESQTVQWASSDPSVAAVSEAGEVTALAVGSAEITAASDDGAYTAQCDVTVEENYVVEVSIEQLSPGTLLEGDTKTLSASVTYQYKTDETGTVTWSTTDSRVATVDSDGVVSAWAKGKAVISAIAGDKGHDGTDVVDVYKLTVLPSGSSSDEDILVLTPPTQNVTGSSSAPLVLNAPDVAVMNGDTNVTGLYTISYQWNYNNKAYNAGDTLTLFPTESGNVVCHVTAVNNTDKTHILTSAGVYSLRLLDGVTAEGKTAVETGSVALGSLVGGTEDLSIPDQLLSRSPGLLSLTFDPATITGDEVGSLIVQGDVDYSVEETGENPLSALIFSPVQSGVYSIGFVARSGDDQQWSGQLKITVTGASSIGEEEADLTCGSEGIAMTEAMTGMTPGDDPAVAMVFGTPKHGLLLRNLSFSGGVSVSGDRYYIADEEQGDYPLSTLTYLPKAGYTGMDSLPITVIYESGFSAQESISIKITSRDTSQIFPDVTAQNEGVWAADSVDFAYACGLMNGMDGGLFAPSDAMSRGMLVTVLYRVEGSPVTLGRVPYQDVSRDTYYYDAVRWASASGIVTGDDLGNFNPETALTREQLTTILYRYAAYRGKNVEYTRSLTGFRDASAVSDYAIDGMSWAVEKGILSGISDLDPTVLLLAPHHSASRAQVAAILHRYLTM